MTQHKEYCIKINVARRWVLLGVINNETHIIRLTAFTYVDLASRVDSGVNQRPNYYINLDLARGWVIRFSQHQY